LPCFFFFLFLFFSVFCISFVESSAIFDGLEEPSWGGGPERDRMMDLFDRIRDIVTGGGGGYKVAQEVRDIASSQIIISTSTTIEYSIFQ
jgi:hypothetical protein